MEPESAIRMANATINRVLILSFIVEYVFGY